MLRDLRLHGRDLFELVEEPGIDAGHLVQLFHGHALVQGVADVGETLGMRRDQPLREDARLDLLRADFLAGFERAYALHQRFLEGAPDGHGFAYGLHLWPQAFVSAGEFFELPLGNLGHYIIDGWLKTGWGLLGDVVGNFVERVA